MASACLAWGLHQYSSPPHTGTVNMSSGTLVSGPSGIVRFTGPVSVLGGALCNAMCPIIDNLTFGGTAVLGVAPLVYIGTMTWSNPVNPFTATPLLWIHEALPDGVVYPRRPLADAASGEGAGGTALRLGNGEGGEEPLDGERP